MNEYDLHLLTRAERVDRFVELIEQVDREDESFTITRDGEAVAVVVSARVYEELMAAWTIGEAR